jgi:hypothetical protein
LSLVRAPTLYEYLTPFLASERTKILHFVRKTPVPVLSGDYDPVEWSTVASGLAISGRVSLVPLSVANF